MRSAADRGSELADRGITVVDIDVTRDDSVREGVERAVDLTGRLDVLVNNAGVVMHGAMEATTDDDLRRLFDTNVLGPHRMARAALPYMRAQGRGLIVQVSSGAGRIVLPGGGAYSASKWALEAMGEALKWELGEFGVDCVIVELGPFETAAFGSSLRRPSDDARSAVYRNLNEAKQKDRQRDGHGPGTSAAKPETVVKPVAQLIRAPRGERPTRLTIHPYADRLDPYNRSLAAIESEVLAERFPDFMLNGL